MTCQDYTVIGYWADSGERYGDNFAATSARDAENQMLEKAREEDGDFRIAGTMVGQHEPIDKYTAYIDPDDPRNDERDGLDVVIEELEVTEYTVLGIITSISDQRWNRRTGGQRYIAQQQALSPRIAEDLARDEVRERDNHLQLIVCAVFEGHKDRCESFEFSNHDERVAH